MTSLYYSQLEMAAGGGGGGRFSELLSTSNVKQLLDSVDAFLFDCDGVIWRGDVLIDGVPETLDLLRSMGKKLVFVTNNSTKSRKQYSNKFHALGITVSEDEIFSSSFAAAMYLKVNNFPKEKKVYVIGGEGILDELELAGFTGLGGPEDGKKAVELKPNSFFDHDKNVGAVVVGLDPQINYYKLQYGTLCIRENPGCLFIATNRDAVGHMTDLQEWPGAGCMVAAICGSTEREPVVVGKPSTFMMNFLLQKFNINTSRMCMVGDRLDTDILFGHNAGCRTLLVLSGVTNASTLEDPSNNIRPEYYTSKDPPVYAQEMHLLSLEKFDKSHGLVQPQYIATGSSLWALQRRPFLLNIIIHGHLNKEYKYSLCHNCNAEFIYNALSFILP